MGWLPRERQGCRVGADGQLAGVNLPLPKFPLSAWGQGGLRFAFTETCRMLCSSQGRIRKVKQSTWGLQGLGDMVPGASHGHVSCN